jgi:type IV pilus assembly protein PilV
MMLIEALMAILIFSLGILGMVGVNALAVASQSDAQYRTDANKFATEIINQIWVNVDRTTDATIASSLGVFEHQPGGAACAFTGNPSTDPLITNWAAAVTAAGSGLPGATGAMQQISVANTTAGMNEVTVTVCWKASGDAVARKHVMKSLIN